MAKFARQRNETILTQSLPWFCLRDARFERGDWVELFPQDFGDYTYYVKERRLREIKEAMHESWYQMLRGEILLAQFGMGGGQFENAESVLAAFGPRHATSRDAQPLRDFAREPRDRLRAKGHGAAMKK